MMNDTTNWHTWIGRQQVVSDTMDAVRVSALAATLDIDDVVGAGDALRPGWQWLFFNTWVPARHLDNDGHPRRDIPESFLPPIPLSRRMWAGGRLRYQSPLIIGATATRRSTIKSITEKRGKSGDMCFVTIEHMYQSNGTVCIVEEQDIVYCEPPGRKSITAPPAAAVSPQVKEGFAQFLPDAVTLFRYSALTGNGHRIHYDADYARDVEGYPGLVVHGPLTATLLQEHVCRLNQGKQIATFEFRGQAPLFVDSAIVLTADVEQAEGSQQSHVSLAAMNPHGLTAMKATCVLR